MEWTRIEAKWHDMARRLQQGYPSIQSTTEAVTDAVSDVVSRVESETAPDPLMRAAADVTVRAEV